jgi:hypothetical protein
MDRVGISSEARVIVLSVLAGLAAPLVFVFVIVARKVERRVHIHTRFWGKRLRAEVARWS